MIDFNGEAVSEVKHNFVINLTNRCNLDCEYCFMKGYHTDKDYFKDMSMDTAKRTIDLIAKIDRHVAKHVLLTGGEILLMGEDYIYELLKYMDESFDMETTTVGIQTNMTLANDNLIKTFDHFGISVSSSFDTFDSCADRRKFTDLQKETVINSLVKIKETFGQAGFIMVLHEGNVDDFEITFNQLKKYGLEQSFACLRVIENGKFEYDNMKEFSKKIIENVYKVSLRHGKIERLFEEDLGYMIADSGARDRKLCSCGDCTLNSMTVYPDGSIATCFYNKKHKNWHYANIHELNRDLLEAKEKESFKNLRKELKEITKEHCISCPIYSACEGPCWETAGTLDNGIPNKSHCDIRKYGILYTYNFLMTMTHDEMFDYGSKMFYLIRVEEYNLEAFQAKIEKYFKETYLLLVEELGFDENIYR